MSDTNKQIAIYQTDDGSIHLDVQGGPERSVITKHLCNIFAEGVLEEKSNVQKMHIANSVIQDFRISTSFGRISDRWFT